MPELAALRQSLLIATTPGLYPLPPAARHILRGGPEVRIAAGRALGLEIPAAACCSASAGERAVLWLGPDEWLLVNAGPIGEEFPTALTAALAGLPHSLTDVSHRQIGLLLSGREASTLLATGCPLDLDRAAFPPGMCTRTMFAKAEIVLWRTDTLVFRLEVWRSFAPYVAALLAEAARGLPRQD